MAKIEYRPDSIEFYSGDNFYRSGELAAYCTTDAVFPAAKAYSDLDTVTFTARGAKSSCDGIGTITANACTASSYEPVALKTDVSEIGDALKDIAARVAALEASASRMGCLRRELKTLNYKREL